MEAFMPFVFLYIIGLAAAITIATTINMGKNKCASNKLGTVTDKNMKNKNYNRRPLDFVAGVLVIYAMFIYVYVDILPGVHVAFILIAGLVFMLSVCGLSIHRLHKATLLANSGPDSKNDIDDMLNDIEQRNR